MPERMGSMLSLVENEIVKVIFRKKLLVVFLIIIFLVLLFAYGEHVRAEKANERITQRLGMSQTDDWRVYVEQQLLEHEQRLNNPYITEERRSKLRGEVEQYAYYLQQDINPTVIGSATFTRTFMEQSVLLLLPLLVMLLVTDLISGEFSGRTVKLLLTKPIARWKVLTSKMITMVLLVTILLTMLAAISIAISSIIFGYGGWNAPVATGFAIVNGKLDVSNVISVPQWKFVLMVYGLAWLVGIVIGLLTMMVSVLVKNTGITIGIMMSLLIAGGFLSFFLEDWQLVKYFFMVHLNITSYLSGVTQPVEGMTFFFSVTVLAIWAVAAIITSFIVFNRQDVLA